MKKNDQIPYRIYLDQNIYDDLVKSRYSLESEINFLIVYSTSTLAEISRMTTDYRTKFLEVLRDNNSEYIWIEKGLAYFKDVDPFLKFEDYLNNINEYPIMQDMMDFALKLHGGRQEVSFDELLSKQQTSFISLLQDGLNDLDDEIKKKFDEEFKELKKNGRIVFDQLKKQLHEFYGENESINPRKEIEKTTGLSAKRLNNIKAPNIIEKIFTALKENSPDFEKEFGVPEDYFKWETFNINKKDIFSKINFIFNFLNIVGYWPDNNIANENKFNAAMSDSQHASYAAYTNEFYTRDYKFSKRLFAVYEYLNIGTKIKYFSLEPTKG